MTVDALLASWADTPTRQTIIEFFDDGPTKPVRIWTRVFPDT